MRAIVVLWFLIAVPGVELSIDAPAELAPARARLAAVDPAGLADLLTLAGLAESGPPIPVVLATETSEWARSVSAWTAGLALGGDRIVLFPARSPVYPHDTLEDVFRHEVMHVLVARATGGRPVPRWFNEGLAMYAERPWALEDRTRVAYALALGPTLTLDEIDDLFAGDRGAQSRAYALAGGFVRLIVADHGRGVAARLFARIATGVPFDEAYVQITGRTLREVEARFWEERRIWTTWVPLVTSTAMLWLIVTLLAMYAARQRRLRRAAVHRQWAADEAVHETDPAPERDDRTSGKIDES